MESPKVYKLFSNAHKGSLNLLGITSSHRISTDQMFEKGRQTCLYSPFQIEVNVKQASQQRTPSNHKFWGRVRAKPRHAPKLVITVAGAFPVLGRGTLTPVWSEQVRRAYTPLHSHAGHSEQRSGNTNTKRSSSEHPPAKPTKVPTQQISTQGLRCSDNKTPLGSVYDV